MAELTIVRKKHRSSTQSPCVYTLRIDLLPDHIQPPIWRRLEVDGRISLGKLHHFIHAAFGWHDAHLHEFIIRDRTFAIPHQDDALYDREIEDERKAFLNRLLGDGDVFYYGYDFGDNWQHEVKVESIEDDQEVDLKGGALVTDGARACPPEDVGGPGGYHAFLGELLSDPNSETAKAMIHWAGGAFDPNLFDKRLANAAIIRLMYNGWGGK